MEHVIVAILLSIPFYFIWNELAPVYFYWLPEIYRHLPFWNCMGLFIIFAIARVVLAPPPTQVFKGDWKGKFRRG